MNYELFDCCAKIPVATSKPPGFGKSDVAQALLHWFSGLGFPAYFGVGSCSPNTVL
jgi:hypothetical protein